MNNTETIIKYLKLYNEWRRGDEKIGQPNPTEIGKFIDEACEMLTSLERERDEAREELKHITEYGTEEINAAVELRQKLASALVERDEAREALREIWQSGDAFLPYVDNETTNRWRKAAGWEETK